jgi:hypothetical protein
MAPIVSSCRFEIPAHAGKRTEYVLRKAAENPGVAYRSHSWVLFLYTRKHTLPFYPHHFPIRSSGQSQLQINRDLRLKSPPGGPLRRSL